MRGRAAQASGAVVECPILLTTNTFGYVPDSLSAHQGANASVHRSGRRVRRMINTSELNTWAPLVRVPRAAQEQAAVQERAAVQEQAAVQEAAPRVLAVPIGLAAGEPPLAPAEQVLGGQALAGPAPRQGAPRPWGRGPGPWEPERHAQVVPAPSPAAVALAAQMLLCGLAAQIPSPAEPDWPGEAPSLRGHESPQGRVESLVPVRLGAPQRGSASQRSAGSPCAPMKDQGPFSAVCWPVQTWAFPAVGRPWAVCRRAPAKAWVRQNRVTPLTVARPARMLSKLVAQTAFGGPPRAWRVAAQAPTVPATPRSWWPAERVPW
jgi:hypothetical protein